MVNAGGGWDPMFLCDPKTGTEFDRVSAQIGEAGEHRFPDVAVSAEELGLDPAYAADYDAILLSNGEFFGKHGERLLVMNGVDTSTNNHDGGSRAIWSGRLALGYPAFGALVASIKRREAAMTFLSGGGYDATENLIPLTRVRNANSLRRVARPDMLDPANPESERYHTAGTLKLIRDARSARWKAMASKARLPRIRESLADLQLARASGDVLKDLEIPETPVEIVGGQLNDLQQMMQQSQLAVSAFRSGLAVAASVSLGGFDTHGNHDRDQRRQQAKLLAGIDFLWEEAARAGLQDKVVIMVGSDFGRGPHYNAPGDGAGKDHWPVTSVLMMGKGVPGGRVIGATDDRGLPRRLDASTLQPTDSGGVSLKPGHVHQSLRRLAGIADDPVAKRFPLAEEELPLLEG
jgi:hypothetical protein